MKNILTNKEHTTDFLRSTYALNPECSDELLKTDDYYKAEDIINIDKLVHEIIQSEEVLFYTHEVRDFLGERHTITKHIECEKPYIVDGLLHYIDSNVFKLVESSYPVHNFNPYILLFLTNIRDKLGFDNGKAFSYKAEYQENDEAERLKYKNYYADRVAELNAFIDSIRLEAKSQEFEKTIKKYQRQSNDNYKSLVKYINKLFDENIGMMVVRVDFGYKENDPYTKEKQRKQNPYDMEKERDAKCLQAQADRKHLFNDCRCNKIFKHMLGYAWKLEYGFIKGFHYHMFFFFDRSQVWDAEDKARSIGEYWKTTITKGRGLYHNCNADKGSYKYLGIGMINNDDFNLRKDLEKASLYLTKNDYCKVEYIIAKKKVRIFGKKEK
jgi:Inovirus Gp2